MTARRGTRRRVLGVVVLLVAGGCLAQRDRDRDRRSVRSPPRARVARGNPDTCLGPQDGGTPAVRFAVIGDYGWAGPGEAAVAALVARWRPDFVITVGDNNYPAGEAATIDDNIGQYFHAFIAPYTGKYGPGADRNRFFPSLGNHDWLSPDAAPYLDYFTLPGNERYYDFTWGAVQLFALDSELAAEPDGTSADSVQAQWLKTQLATATAPWRIAYMHHPPFSSGPHGSQGHMQWPFGAWGVDLVLAGHDHDYERLEVDGTSYVVCGLGGAPQYEFGPSASGSAVRYRDNYGAALIEATADRLHLRFETVDGFRKDDACLVAGS